MLLIHVVLRVTRSQIFINGSMVDEYYSQSFTVHWGWNNIGQVSSHSQLIMIIIIIIQFVYYLFCDVGSLLSALFIIWQESLTGNSSTPHGTASYMKTTGNRLKVWTPPLTGIPEQQRFPMQSGMRTSISSRPHSAIAAIHHQLYGMSRQSTDLIIMCACIICIVFDGSEVQLWNHKLGYICCPRSVDWLML